MIEDPYTFGQIATANALSDIYAMGGQVKTALNIVCFPEKMDLNILGKILQGGNDKVQEAGGILAGGHSIADTDIKYGLSVMGTVNPKKIWRNNGCQLGDVLLLTKPLGVGIICTANRIGQASQEGYRQAVDSMTRLNRYAAEILQNYTVHACTDVTGFGLLVHLLEMLDGQFSACLDCSSIPYFPECKPYAEEFYLTAAAQKNRNHASERVFFDGIPFYMEEILFDPQTSGGLLVSLPEKEAWQVQKQMKERGQFSEMIGRVTSKEKYEIIIK